MLPVRNLLISRKWKAIQYAEKTQGVYINIIVEF